MCIHLGREARTKGYRLYDPNMHTIHVSQDVVFEEAKGWDWNNSHSEGTLSSSTIVVTGHEVGSQDLEGDGSDSENFGEREEDQNGGTTTPPDSSADMSPVSRSPHDTPSQGERASILELEETYDKSEPPHKFRLIADVYNETEGDEIFDALLLAGIDEPICYLQAEKEQHWREAMECEMRAIEENQTWELTDLPPGHRAIGLKWVYKTKRDTNGNILKHKARLVAKVYV